jgi:DNA invertase Pin-like site-specific DNA recombinase
MGKRVAIYVRVSTDLQTTTNQELELKAVADRAGWEIVQTYADLGVSGAKSRKDRPGFDQLLRDASRRKFDLIACWSVDRLGRSLKDLVGFLQEVHALGLGLYLHQQAVDTSTPAGAAMFQMLAVFSEFERALIRERVLAGLARARANGQRLGRPLMPKEKHEAVVAALREGGHSLRSIAKRCRVGLTSVQRIKDRMPLAPPRDASVG